MHISIYHAVNSQAQQPLICLMCSEISLPAKSFLCLFYLLQALDRKLRSSTKKQISGLAFQLTFHCLTVA